MDKTKIIVAACLVLCANVARGSDDSDVNNETVTYSLYTRSTFEAPEKLILGETLSLLVSKYDPTKKTLVLVHGYQNTINSSMDQLIKNEILKKEDANVISVEWEYFTRNLNYLWTLSKTKPVGEYIGQFLSFLIDQGTSPSALHLIGHSLGAHASGFAGKYLRRHNRTVSRISGLDPAWPGFLNYFDVASRLDAGDAHFTDCIHTCGGELGVPLPICQADFYPNGGTCIGQPGCAIFDKPCAHGRAYEYFAESIDPTHRFEAKTCLSLTFGIPLGCEFKGALMGYPASPEFKGLFYLKTGRKYPFALSIEGK